MAIAQLVRKKGQSSHLELYVNVTELNLMTALHPGNKYVDENGNDCHEKEWRIEFFCSPDVFMVVSCGPKDGDKIACDQLPFTLKLSLENTAQPFGCERRAAEIAPIGRLVREREVMLVVLGRVIENLTDINLNVDNPEHRNLKHLKRPC